MNVAKHIILEIVFLIAILLCTTVAMKILDVLFKFNYENIWTISFEIGFFAWLILSIIIVIVKIKTNK